MANKRKKYNASSRSGGNRADKRTYDKEDDRVETKGKGSTKRTTVKGANDPAWYTTDPSTLKAVANFPFGNPAGFDVPWVEAIQPDDPDTVYSDSRAVPGVMGVRYVPAMGSPTRPTDPINMAAQTLYTKVRGANSGAKNYEPADLMVYLLAMDNIYMVYAALMRAYSTLYQVNVMNRYVPRALFEAQGFKYDSFIGRTADFKAFIDQTAIRMASMALPADIKYFTRHQYLASSIFTDSAVSKAQYIVYVPDQVLMYDGYSDRKGGRLIGVNWARRATNMTFEDMVETVNMILDRVVDDADCGIISGDILKAFGAEGLMRVPIIPADLRINPVFDGLQLLQLHNAMIIGEVTTQVEQTNPSDPYTARTLVARSRISDLRNVIPGSTWIIDMPVDEVTPELMIEATRFVHPLVKDNTGWYISNCGSEVLCSIHMYTYVNGTITRNICFSYMDATEMTPVVLQYISQTNTHPAIITYQDNNGALSNFVRLGQVDNYTPLALSKIGPMNNMALTALFDSVHNANFIHNLK